MAPTKRKQTYDRSDSFVARSSTSPPPATSSTWPNKRAKPSTTTSTSSSKPPSKQTDADGNPYWPISTARRVTISDFKGKKMVSVREYYEKDGTWLPGKKGITMTVEQYSELVGLLPQIEKALGEDGERVGRPNYGDGDASADEDESVEEEEGDAREDEDEDEDGDSEVNGKHKKKANIDATSDEDED